MADNSSGSDPDQHKNKIGPYQDENYSNQVYKICKKKDLPDQLALRHFVKQSPHSQSKTNLKRRKTTPVQAKTDEGK
jgi:hypothetical protein